jgi:NAD+ kinase
MKIGLYGKNINYDFFPYLNTLLEILDAHQSELFIYEPFFECIEKSYKKKLTQYKVFKSHENLPSDSDFLISIGGDGTFLETVSLVRDSEIPIIGVNSGRLGFLANISREDIPDAFTAIFNDKFSYERRALIEFITPENIFGDLNFGLNEVTIQKKDSSLITIHTYLDHEFLNSYWTDGLIISTPTGSTAYSLSLGGPIMLPNSKNFVITPIASHTLTVRPLVIPDDKEITIRLEGRSDNFLATVDNRVREFSKNTDITIRKAGFCVKMLKLHYNDFYSTLRHKLMWGMDKRN